MVDPISLSLALGGIAISLIAYIKHSSCCRGVVEFDTRTNPSSPLLKEGNFTKTKLQN